MSISASGKQMKSLLIVSPGTSGGTSVETSIDATEDRKIHSVEIYPRAANWTALDMQLELFTGNDPTAAEPPASDDTDDNESLYVRRGLLIESDTTNGQGGSFETAPGRFRFSQPYEWDEHVTLTLEAQNNAATQTAGMAVVRYTEA